MPQVKVPDWSAPEGKVRLLYEVGTRIVEILIPYADVRITAATLAKGGAKNISTVDDKGEMRNSFDYPD